MWVLKPRYKLSRLLPELVDRNRAAIKVVDEFPLPSNLWMVGPHGSGRTHVAIALGNRYHVNGNTVEMMRGPDFRSIGGMWPAERDEELRRFIFAKLLIIDDIDKCVWTPEAVEALWSVMDLRCRWGLRTITTANVTGEALHQQIMAVPRLNDSWAGAVMDRFNPCVRVEFAAPVSLRKAHSPEGPEVSMRPQPVELVSPEEAARVRAITRSLGSGNHARSHHAA